MVNLDGQLSALLVFLVLGLLFLELVAAALLIHQREHGQPLRDECPGG